MENTIAAIATGNAPAGIGVIRISGAHALEIAAAVFQPLDGTSLADLKGYRAKYGNIVMNGETADNAVALVFRAPKSYTGEDVVELSVHGGLLLVQKTLEAVFRAGAVPAEAGEFTKRAFLNGKMDLTQAESVAALISAEGEQSLRASFSALQGVLGRHIQRVLEALLACAAQMAAWVDYPEEEIPELSAEALEATLTDACRMLETLLAHYEEGQIATKGVVAAIVGKPNAGKSSLMNLLTGKDKSIVTPIAGTTRDIVEETVSLGGIILHLQDTAGLRHSDDMVEAIGIQKAHEALEQAQLVLAVFDSAAPLTEADEVLIEQCRGKQAVAVINKTDLPLQLDTAPLEAAFPKTVYISAQEETGMAALAEAVTSLLGVAGFDSSAPMLANKRQKQHCRQALTCLQEALDGVHAGVTYDAINVMIDAAADELLSLTGKKATEEVVNNIFSQFCVGK